MSRLPARHGRDHVPNGYDPIPGLRLSPRLVYGTIFPAGGTDDPGSGDWEESWSSNGTDITVDPPFNSAIKVVICSPTNSGAVTGFVVVDTDSSDVDTFRVDTFDQIADPADIGFAFVAIEQP